MVSCCLQDIEIAKSWEGLQKGNDMKSHELYEQVPLLATFDRPDLEQLLARPGILEKTFAAGELIHLAEERCDSVDIILAGKVIVEYSEADGHYLVVTQLGSGDLIGGQIIFSARPFYPMTLTAEQPTRLLSISRSDLLDLLQSQDVFLMSFLRLLSDNAARLSGKIRQTVRRSIRECVINFLKEETSRQGSQTIQLPITKKAFAEKIGVQRTSLSRELQKMKKDGLIDYTTATVTLLRDF
jgi:CRP-like cAMP-binding protein